MATKRENQSAVRDFERFDIGGNVFRVYYDVSGTARFVVDETISDIKPNVMLVMDGVAGRKWDDVLANDYDVDLETVRPRRDNKYQKLDVSYVGMDAYIDLAYAWIDDDDVDGALEKLRVVRLGILRNEASERLDAARDAADKAGVTITRAESTISELTARIRELRAKLKEQRGRIGREPTKQSASKILRLEAQIDIANEKLARAKKRRDGARRRLVSADEEMELARQIIARIDEIESDRVVFSPAPVVAPDTLPMAVADADDDNAVVADDASADDEIEDEIDDGEDDDYEDEFEAEAEPSDDDDAVADSFLTDAPLFREVSFEDGDNAAPLSDVADTESEQQVTEEPRTEEMSENNDVKPLFDQDPEILDEEIAFKPIEFNAAATAATPRAATPVVEPGVAYDEPVAPSPLSFVPPHQTATPMSDTASQSPVLDTITSVQEPAEYDKYVAAEPVVEPTPRPIIEPEYQESVAAPQYAQQPQPQQFTSQPQPTPMPSVSPAAADSAFRPTSPIKNKNGGAAPVSPSAAKKPTLMYYIMLIALIVLAICTLWLYQKANRGATPDLLASAAVETETVAAEPEKPQVEPIKDVDLFVAPIEPTDVAETAPIVEPEPVVVIEAEPEPVAIVPEPEPEPEPIPVAVVTEEPTSPFIEPLVPVKEPEPIRLIPTAEEIMAAKPAYNVSQQENMFVADDNYVSDRVTQQYDNDEFDYDVMPTEVVPVAETVPQIVASEVITSEEVSQCANGGAPDIYGCCPGEEYTDLGDQGFLCCAGDDCFDPMF